MANEVDQYFNAVPPDRVDRMRTLHELIVSLYPDATVDLTYRMPTYRYGDGWVALANQKRYISLYTCDATHLAAFRKRHPTVRTGKGCINLRPNGPLPLDDIASVIRHAIEHRKTT